jgi:molybdopterin-guanine dinucleotide biosynthesis protein A
VSTTESIDRPDGLAAVVLAGGAGRRLGGADKPGVEVAGRSLLDHVLLACPESAQIVVVGPPRPTARPVGWTREEPPGGGPVAGLAAGLRLVEARLVLVLASDLPRVGAALDPLLRGASAAVADGMDGAWVVDDAGRGQPLVSCLLSARIRSAMPTVPQGYPLHRVLAELRLIGVTVPRGSVSDVDTPDDLATVRQDLGEPTLGQPTQEDHDE